MGLWFSCIREIFIDKRCLVEKILETNENSNKLHRIFVVYYYALFRLGEKLLMIKKQSHVKKTHFREIETR